MSKLEKEQLTNTKDHNLHKKFKEIEMKSSSVKDLLNYKIEERPKPIKKQQDLILNLPDNQEIINKPDNTWRQDPKHVPKLNHKVIE